MNTLFGVNSEGKKTITLYLLLKKKGWGGTHSGKACINKRDKGSGGAPDLLVKASENLHILYPREAH